MKKRRKMVIDVVRLFMWYACRIHSWDHWWQKRHHHSSRDTVVFWLGVFILVSAFITGLSCSYCVFFKLDFNLRLDMFDIAFSRINSCMLSFSLLKVCTSMTWRNYITLWISQYFSLLAASEKIPHRLVIVQNLLGVHAYLRAGKSMTECEWHVDRTWSFFQAEIDVYMQFAVGWLNQMSTLCTAVEVTPVP
jgi:hypothetical protein